MSAHLFIISGPSGVGKGTLVSMLQERMDNIWVSVSATTRSPRIGEVEGIHYFFIDGDEFNRLIEEDELLEWACVHGINKYGTLKGEVMRHLEEGIDVILEIDQQGAFAVKDKMPEALLVFIAPPSKDELISRLKTRGTESQEEIARRMETAELEFSQQGRYNISIVNDDLEVAYQELKSYIQSFR